MFDLWSEKEAVKKAKGFAKSKESAIVLGEAERVLGLFPPELFQTCVTSPPYWYVRDYDVQGQLGLEPSLDDFVYRLVMVFSQVHRVLREDGVLWLNIGDGYTSGGRTWRAPDKKNPKREMSSRPPTPQGLKPKDLLGVPWRLAFALQQPWLLCPRCGLEEHSMRWGRQPGGEAICPGCFEASLPKESRNGWYLRSEIIWYRPNCQPESVRDRVTRSHEHLFMLSKNERYFYDNQARRWKNNRNLRTVWSFPTKPGQYGHIAPFPEELIDPCLALSSKEGDLVLDPFLGSGTTALVAEKLGRRFLGIELNSEYAQTAKGRIQSLEAGDPSSGKIQEQ